MQLTAVHELRQDGQWIPVSTKTITVGVNPVRLLNRPGRAAGWGQGETVVPGEGITSLVSEAGEERYVYQFDFRKACAQGLQGPTGALYAAGRVNPTPTA